MLFSVVLLTNMTRANEIGANSYLLDLGQEGSVILDAGSHPRLDGYEGTPDFAPSGGKDVRAIFLTHAHHDHTGSLPLAMRAHPKARVFMSEGTYFLADPLLHNSVEVMTKQRSELGISEYPLYTHGELAQLTQRWQACGLGKSWSLDGYPNPKNEPVSFSLHDAGHILGSVGVRIEHRGRSLFYTGDINFADQRLMKAASFPTSGIDILVTETTRGGSPRKEARGPVIERFFQAMDETFAQGGAVLVPIFAMGKTQELLAEIYIRWREGRFGRRPLYIGGLSKTFSAIYDKLAQRSVRAHPDIKLLNDKMPEIMDGRRLKGFKPRKGDLYLLSSGMMTPKTLSNTLGQRFLSEEKNSVFFVGYCDPESPAGALLETPKGGHVVLDPITGELEVKCRVEHFDMTAHAQREDILDYILKTDPKVCVLVHGDPPALEWFQAQLRELRPNMKIVIPPPGQPVAL
ncbi:MAG: MBL fold metallo-hydrolase [Verrucomicrobium sp.]|nr:MBL fold metallo-hydrolase [Verrucomicrobium sp.]